jgi:hypothetical protein
MKGSMAAAGTAEWGAPTLQTLGTASTGTDNHISEAMCVDDVCLL